MHDFESAVDALYRLALSKPNLDILERYKTGLETLAKLNEEHRNDVAYIEDVLSGYGTIESKLVVINRAIEKRQAEKAEKVQASAQG